MGYWLLLAGAGMWVVMLGAVIFGKKTTTQGCPQCQHQAGLDDQRQHCPEQDDYNGWASDRCDCVNDYHWNYETR